MTAQCSGSWPRCCIGSRSRGKRDWRDHPTTGFTDNACMVFYCSVLPTLCATVAAPCVDGRGIYRVSRPGAARVSYGRGAGTRRCVARRALARRHRMRAPHGAPARGTAPTRPERRPGRRNSKRGEPQGPRARRKPRPAAPRPTKMEKRNSKDIKERSKRIVT